MTYTFDLTATKSQICELIIARKVRDANLASGGLKRSESYCAFFATDRFAQIATDCAIDLNKMFNRCDKTLNRLELFLKAIAEDTFFMRNESDQNRYIYGLIKSMVNAHNMKLGAITRADKFAATQKVEGAADHVVSLSRIMSDLTSERQGGIATYVLEDLGFCEFVRNGRMVTGYKVKPKSAIFKRLARMVKAEQAGMNTAI